MNNFTKVSVAQDARTELHDKLSLTGAEISVNNLPAGAGVPFVHSHKKNEEIYIILSGKGKAVIDDETVELNAGDFMRIAPSAKDSSLQGTILQSVLYVFRLRKTLLKDTQQMML